MTTESQTPVDRVIAFLTEIGLTLTPVPGATGFIKGIMIVDGGLHYDPETVRTSDLLHEAGHVAIVPSMYRHHAQGALKGVFAIMGVDLLNRWEIDSPESRAILQCSEAEAIAWSYAAGVAIGLEPDQIIHPDDFQGDGDGVRFMVSMGAHFGVHGLYHAGMIERVQTYPTMVRWLQK